MILFGKSKKTFEGAIPKPPSSLLLRLCCCADREYIYNKRYESVLKYDLKTERVLFIARMYDLLIVFNAMIYI